MNKYTYKHTKLSGYAGFFVQAIVNNFLPILFVALQDVCKFTYEQLGNLIVFNFATQMVIDFMTPKLLELTSYRTLAILSQFTAFAGLALMGILPSVMNPYIAVIICIIIYAAGSGLAEVILSPMIEMLPTKNKSANMAVLHSFYCWGQAFTVILTTALVYILGFSRWNYIPLIWSIIPFINMWSFFKVPIVEPQPDEKTSTFSKLIKDKRFSVYMLMMLCAGAAEMAMAEWASLFAQRALGVSKAVGDLTGPCAFALFMGLGRIIYAKYSKKISFTKLILFFNLLCFACYIIVAVCKIPFVSLVFCAFCGFTVSISWPGIYSAGARTFPAGGALMFSTFAMCGDMGCCLAPWLVGIVADNVNLNVGFAVASVFPLIMVICGFYILKNKDCKTAE